MLTFAVMPCLNEAANVEGSVGSLLAQAGDVGSDLHLVVVDNGSTDGTVATLGALAERHHSRLHVRHEARRGYVPPRATGVRAAAHLAETLGVAAARVLILQCDADTRYFAGYVASMQAAAVGAAEGVLLEGSIRRDPQFLAQHPDYVRAERHVDEDLEPFEADDDRDVVLDDKVCGYRLSDYLRWGGLQEESDERGDPLHAETTRMFLRARLAEGARKLRVNAACAAPSRRKVIADPRLHFATLGYPHGGSEVAARTSGRPPIGVDEFARAVLAGRELDAVWSRTAHLLALFRYLPAALSRLEGLAGEAPASASDVRLALQLMPARTARQVIASPGLLLADALGLARPDPGGDYPALQCWRRGTAAGQRGCGEVPVA